MPVEIFRAHLDRRTTAAEGERDGIVDPCLAQLLDRQPAVVIDAVERIGGLRDGVGLHEVVRRIGYVVIDRQRGPAGAEIILGAQRIALFGTGIATADREMAGTEIELAATLYRLGVVLLLATPHADAAAAAETAGGRGLVGEGGLVVDDELVAGLVVVERGIGAAQEDFRRVARAPVEVEDRALAGPGQVIVAQSVLIGNDEAVRGGRHAPVGRALEILRFDRTLRIIDRQHRAELAVGAEQPADLDIALVRMLVVELGPAIGDARTGEIRLVPVERRQRSNIDRATDRIGILVRGERLGDDHRADERRGDVVEFHLPAFRLRRGQSHAVQRDVDEIGVDPADDDVAPLSLIVRNRQAGQAAHRFGDILVGQFADVVGEHRLDEIVRGAFLLNRLAFASTGTGDDDVARRGCGLVADGIRLRFSPGRRRSLILRLGTAAEDRAHCDTRRQRRFRDPDQSILSPDALVARLAVIGDSSATTR